MAATGVGPRLEDGPARPVRELRGERADRRPAAAGAAAAGDPDGGAPARRRRRRPSRAHSRRRSRRRPGGSSLFLHGLCENESYWQPAPRAHRHDVRRDAGRARLDAADAARQHRAAAARERRRADRARCSGSSTAWPVPVTRIALVGHSLGGLVIRAAGAVADDVERAVERQGHRRDHPRHPAPRRADRVGDRPRQPRAGPAARDRGVRPDPRLALPGRARPGRRARRGRAAAAARALPPGRRDPDRQRSGTRSATWSATCWSGRGRRTAGTAAGAAVPRRRRAARRPHRPLRAAQPPRGARGDASTGWHDRHDSRPEPLPTASCGPRPPSPLRRTRSGQLLTDVSRMPELEPRAGPDAPAQARRAAARASGTSASTAARACVWPTRSVVAVAGARAGSVAWDTKSSGARWIWELTPAGEGTHVVHRRPVPEQADACSSSVVRQVLPRRRSPSTPTSSRQGMAADGRPAQGGRGGAERRSLPQAIHCPSEHRGTCPWNCPIAPARVGHVTLRLSPVTRRPAAAPGSPVLDDHIYQRLLRERIVFLGSEVQATRTPTRSAPSCCCSRPRTPRPTSSCTSTAPVARSTPAWRSTTR